MRIAQAVEKYNKLSPARFHTPGHKGRLNINSRDDVTELPMTGCLYDEEGTIRNSERALAQLMDVKDAFFSAGGATLCIQTMVAMSGTDTIIVGRGAHHSVYNAMALMGKNAISLYPTGGDDGLPGRYTPEAARDAFQKNPQAGALYVTSPDYYGCMSDIAGLRSVCDEYGALLLVDNAHGSHLKLCGAGLHPTELGAHWCVDSWHKTLPVPTGAAVLYTSFENRCSEVKEYMSVFGSTSPSFMTLVAMDRCIDYMAERGEHDFHVLCAVADKLRGEARLGGFVTPRGMMDPARVCVGSCAGEKVMASHFKILGVSPEAVMGGYGIFLLSPFNTEKDFKRLKTAFSKWPYDLGYPKSYKLPTPKVGMGMREALLSEFEEVDTDSVCGRICRNVTNACPPGAPIILPGEIFDEESVKFIKRSGICSVKVVK